MKPARPQEPKCRRLEFQCQLYDVIRDLEKSLISESDSAKYGSPQGSFPVQPAPPRVQPKKGSECCCPPGCCKESLIYRPPKLPPKRGVADPQVPEDHQLPPSEHGWHDHDHGRGCRPGDVAGGQGGPSSPSQGPGGFQFPSTPEEAIQMGCFVARSS